MKKILLPILCLFLLCGCSSNQEKTNNKIDTIKTANDVYEAMSYTNYMPASANECENVDIKKDDVYSSKVYWHDNKVDATSLSDKQINIGGTIEIFDNTQLLSVREEQFTETNLQTDVLFGESMLGNNEKELCNGLKQYIYIKDNIMLRISYSVGKTTAKQYKQAFEESLNNYEFEDNKKYTDEELEQAKKDVKAIADQTLTDMTNEIYEPYYTQADNIDRLFQENNTNGWSKQKYNKVKKLSDGLNIGLLSDRYNEWQSKLTTLQTQFNDNDNNVASNKTLLEEYGKSNAINFAKNQVKKCLKAPSTAEFPGDWYDPYNDWNVSSEGNDMIIVSSYVDSQNSFGAMIRSYFNIKIERINNDYVHTKYLEMDGQVLINN